MMVGLIENARALLRQGKNVEAITLLKSYSDSSDDALTYLTDAYFQSRNWKNALGCVRKAISRQIRLDYHQVLEIQILCNMKQYEDVIKITGKYESKYGSNLKVIQCKKIAYFFLGRIKEAQNYGQLEIQLRASNAEEGIKQHPKLILNKGNKKIISYSLWGNHIPYALGAVINAKNISTMYPSWQARFYVHSDLNKKIQQILLSLGSEIIFADQAFPDVPAYMWRFLIIDDPDVKYFLCRDTDCRLNNAELQLVIEWMESEKKFHVIRDHIFHNNLMLAGLWGGVGVSDLNMRQLISQFHGGKPSNKYGLDQDFLERMIWPRIKHSLFVHDNYYWTPGVKSHKHQFNESLGGGYMDEEYVKQEAKSLGLPIDLFS